MAVLTFEGGLNEQDLSQVNPSECIEGYNFELGAKDTHYRPRKPFEKKGTAPNASAINGIMQLQKIDGAYSTIVQSGDTVYEWDGASTWTSKGTVDASSKLRGLSWVLDSYLVITDAAKLTVVKKWDGTSLTTLTTGLGSTLFARYAVVHLGRVWLFNVKSGTDTPHLLVASAFENPESYDTSLRAKDSSFTTGSEAFFMVTPDLKPVNGVAVFMNQLIISSEGGHLWKLTGTDSKDFAWIPFYSGSYAVGTETMANIGDDIVYMKAGGNIESVVSTDRFGDVKTDDLSRWMRTTVKDFSDAITVYDQFNQKVYFFASSTKVIVLFKEMLDTSLSPWSVYKTDHTATFAVNAAVYMRDPTSTDTFAVYWGDSTGNVYIMDSDDVNGDDDTNSIQTFRRSVFVEKVKSEDNDKPIDPMNDIIAGRIYYRRVANVSLIMGFEWADDYALNTVIVPLKGADIADTAGYFGGTSYFGGVFYFNAGFQLSQRVSTKGYSTVGRGPGFYLELSVNDKQVFDIQKIVL